MYCENCIHKHKEINGWHYCFKLSCHWCLDQDTTGNQIRLLDCINNNWKEEIMGTKQKIEVMQAYLDGKQIEQSYHINKKWCSCSNPTWNWDQYDYRIKPEPKYRQLKPEELITLRGKWLKGKSSKALLTPIEILTDGVFLGSYGHKSPKTLFEDWTYEDGSPVGILEEE